MKGLLLPLIVVCILVSGRCAHDNGQESRSVAVLLTILSGNHQNGQDGETLAQPLVIAVTDEEGNPVDGVALQVDVVEGGGEIDGFTYIESDEDGMVRFEWTIGSSYNAVEISVAGTGYDGDPCYAFAQGENPTGLAVTRTLSSLRNIEGVLYEMTFYGDYSEIVENENRRLVNYYASQPNASVANQIHCSVFAAMNDQNSRLFGRSFDNPEGWRCITLLCRFHPPDGYASLVPTRTQELGYDLGTDLTALPVSGRTGLLEAPFYSPDGINEHGLVVALADIESRQYTPDPGKAYIYKTYLIRKILDYASTVDEAIEIARQHNCYDYGLDTFSTHALVADPSGRSVLLELADGQMQAIPNTESWHVATNSPLYNVSHSQARAQCWRYRTIDDFLSVRDGSLTMEQGMEILETVGYEYTQWSIVYDMNQRRLDLALDFDFNRFYRFEFVPVD